MPDRHEQFPLRLRFASSRKTRKRPSVKKSRPKLVHGGVARIKVTLQGIRPQIWRRLEVLTAISLAGLHDILQTAFDWTNSHLHQFHVGHQRFGLIDDEFDDESADERLARLDQLLPMYDRLLYEYDFGDSWMHLIAVEKTFERETGVSYPRCTGGKRAAPPEDCGGPWGYADFLKSLSDPDHEEHDSMLEWIGGNFDPEAFDPADVNRKLARLSKARRWDRS